MSCVFCIDNWTNLDVVSAPTDAIRIIRPLEPVTEGHVLVIHREHTSTAAESPTVAGNLMWAAAYYCAFHELQANLITSIGPDATQTVFHCHTHIVPRRANDGLALPWTGQKKGLFCPVHHDWHPSPVCDPPS